MAFYPLLVTTDVVVRNPKGQVLVVKRNIDPFRGLWVNPGGHLEKGQTVEECALTELAEETGLVVGPQDLKLINVFSSPERDTRTDYQRISVAYLVEAPDGWEPRLNEEANEWKWIDPKDVSRSDMGFDHFDVITQVRKKYPRRTTS
ncbi:MAG: NUDIX hydrolase [Patescibacteria group bacterium]